MTAVSRVRRVRAFAGAAALAGVIACSASATASAEPRLLGQWRFAETGQTAFDEGPSGLDGRLGESLAVEASDPARIEGVSDGALRFTGDSVVRLPDAFELAPETLSIETVVRASSSPGPWRYVVARGGRSCFAGAYGLYTAPAGGIAFYVFDGARYVVTATAQPADVWDGAWHHVVGTFDGGRLRLYVDGRPVGDPAIADLRIDYAHTSMAAAFGRYTGSCDLSYSGDLDLVRIWSGALPADRIAAAATREVHPGEPLPTQLPAPLPPAAPPARFEATPPGTARERSPGAPPRACALTLSRTRIAARRRTRVAVRVLVRGRPARAVRVAAHRRGKRAALTIGRTGAAGRARLLLRVRRPGRVRISAATTPSCSPRYIRVSKRRWWAH